MNIIRQPGGKKTPVPWLCLFFVSGANVASLCSILLIILEEMQPGPTRASMCQHTSKCHQASLFLCPFLDLGPFAEIKLIDR